MIRKQWRVLAQGQAGNVVDVRCDGTDFDEIVITGFLHLEKLNSRDWCLIIDNPSGKDRVHLTIREGTAKQPPSINIIQGGTYVNRCKGSE